MQYSKLTEICFLDCVSDFTGRQVKPAEVNIFLIMCFDLINIVIFSLQEKCALLCTEKYLKMNQRISQRFQEFQMLSNENLLAASQK